MEYLASFVVNHAFFTVGMGLLANEKIKYKSVRFYVSFLVTLILLILGFDYLNPAMRIIYNFVIYMIYAHLLFGHGFKNSVILGMLIFLFSVCAELIYLLVTLPLIHSELAGTEGAFSSFISNLVIGIILFFLCRIKKCREIYDSLLSITSKLNKKKILVFSLIIIVFYNFICWIAYFVSKDLLNRYYFTLIGSILGVFCSCLIYYYFKNSTKYLNMYDKYNDSLTTIRDFEAALNNYRMNTHENKNQLRTIRNMGDKKKIIAYIDALLKDDTNDDEKLLNKVQKIPNGGLRGIIYSKLLILETKKIPFELLVDKKITNEKIGQIDERTLTHVCQILGVLLDNAIDASSELDDAYVIIEIYDDQKTVNISISNGYEGYIDLESMDVMGVSKKGENRGYGLPFVNYLVSKDAKLEKNSEITEDSFTQTIKIKV